MRHALTWFLVLVGSSVVVGCADDGANRTPPETALDNVPTALSRDKHISITFHANGNANGFVCQLDSGAPSQCVPPFEADVSDGPHTFAVAAAIGTAVDETPAMYSWKVDATAPDTQLVMGPPSLDNTIDPELTFTGSDPGDGPVTFECKLDGGSFAACASPDRIAVTAGTHAFEVRAVDAAGNVDPTPATHNWALDTSTPDTAITSGPPAASTVLPNVSFVFGSPDPAATFECQLDGGAFTACSSPKSYPALADGPHTFVARAKNAAGTVDPTPATRMFIVDGTAPAVSITAKPTDPSNDATPSFTFSSTDSTATFECQIDAGAFATCSPAWTAAALADGAHTLHVRAKDPVGNQGAAATYTWVIDTVAPTVTITAGPTGTVTTADASFTFTTAGAPVAIDCQLDAGAFAACISPKAYAAVPDGMHAFHVRVTDAVGNIGMASRMWLVDTMAPVVTITSGPNNPTADSTPTFTFTVTGATTTECGIDGAFAACATTFTTATLTDGPHTFVVRAADAAGNLASATRTFTVDTTGPTVAIVTKPGNPISSANASFTFTVSEGSPQCKLDGAAFTACTSPKPYTALGDGSHTFTVQSADALGNLGSATYTWTVDTTAPTVTIVTHPTNPTTATAATFTFTVSEGSLQCKLDGAAFATCASPKAYTGLANDSHTFTVQASDALGNLGTASYTWTIDTLPPTVTILTHPTDPTNLTAATFTFSVSEGTPMCKLDLGSFAACATPKTYTGLADGLHTFTVQSADALGNTASATFSWTIDATAPVVTFDSVPPARWPVNYFDVQWHANETATYECSENGATFAACTPGISITTPYSTASTFSVRGKDALGNVGTAVTTSWNPTPGLVLHYAWEQGSRRNTSLLAQVPALSPDVAGQLAAVGGWAGTALRGPAATVYPRTARALTSSTDGTYTVSMWVRPYVDNASGLLWSNANGTAAGHTVRMSSGTITMQVFSNGQTQTLSGQIPFGEWSNVATRTTGTGKGLELLVNGVSFGNVSSANGFDPNQAANLTVGPVTTADVDDLRFYNTALQSCDIVRGEMPPTGAACVAMRPAVELDFEGGQIMDTGTMSLIVSSPVPAFTTFTHRLGDGIRIATQTVALALTNFAQQSQLPGHSITLWVAGSSPPDVLFDYTTACNFAASFGTCGIQIAWTAGRQFQVFTGTFGNTPATQITTVVPGTALDTGMHSFVLAEQRTANGSTGVKFYVDGRPAGSVAIVSGDLFSPVSNTIQSVSQAGAAVDEIELWPRDLSADAEMLCENGFDGEFNPATGNCALTSN